MSSVTFNKVVVSALIAVLACGALVLAGCSGSSSSASSSKASASSASASSASASSSTSSTTASSTSASASSASSAASSTAASSSSTSATSAKASSSYVSTVDSSDPYGAGIHHAVVTVEGYDPFTIELDADQAPVTVANFCKLANEGYYNGLNFYRIQEDFCMQGGTLGNNAAGQDPSIDRIVGEFAVNGVDNALASNYKKGTVAMARTQDYNSAGSTFFITLGTQYASALNDQYAAFGMIDDAGMATVDKIVADYLPNTNQSNMGAIADESKQAKIASITITD